MPIGFTLQPNYLQKEGTQRKYIDPDSVPSGTIVFEDMMTCEESLDCLDWEKYWTTGKPALENCNTGNCNT